MPKAGFTYQIRHLPEEAFGIEGYVVRTSDDASVERRGLFFAFRAWRDPYTSRGAQKP